MKEEVRPSYHLHTLGKPGETWEGSVQVRDKVEMSCPRPVKREMNHLRLAQLHCQAKNRSCITVIFHPVAPIASATALGKYGSESPSNTTVAKR